MATQNGPVSILLGNGNGSFGAKTDFSASFEPQAIAVGDFNGDGKLDLAVGNAGVGTVSILLGVGDGTFGAKTDFGVGINPESIAVGDFNGDGKVDLAVANLDSNTVSILLGAGDGTFGAKTDFATGFLPFSVAVGDFNGDGNLDLAVANSDAFTVSVLLGTGTGTFGAKTDFITGGPSDSVAVGDFNGDGKLDLAVGNQNNLSGLNTVSVLLGTGTGAFGAKTDFITSGSPFALTAGDFNGDGKLDLVTAGFNSNTVSILLNGIPVPATNLAITQINGGSDPTAGVPFSVVVQSQDGGGNPDSCFGRYQRNTVVNDGNGNSGRNANRHHNLRYKFRHNIRSNLQQSRERRCNYRHPHQRRFIGAR